MADGSPLLNNLYLSQIYNFLLKRKNPNLRMTFNTKVLNAFKKSKKNQAQSIIQAKSQQSFVMAYGH